MHIAEQYEFNLPISCRERAATREQQADHARTGTGHLAGETERGREARQADIVARIKARIAPDCQCDQCKFNREIVKLLR